MLRHHPSHGPILGAPTDHFHGVQHLQSFPRALAIGPIGCSNLFRAKQFSIRNQENDLCVLSGKQTWIAGKSTYKNGDVLLKPPWLHAQWIFQPRLITRRYSGKGQGFVSIHPIAIHQNHGSHLAIFGKTNWLVYLQLLGVIGRRTNHGNPEKTHPKMFKFKVWVWHNKNCYPLAV